jgi:hypothetical protein
VQGPHFGGCSRAGTCGGLLEASKGPVPVGEIGLCLEYQVAIEIRYSVSTKDVSSLFKAMAAPSKIDPATAVLDRFDHSNDKSYATLSGLRSTLWHRDHGRPSVHQKVPSNNTSPSKKRKR